MKVDAVVMAGGDGAVIDPTCRFKGLLPVAGRPMVEWVVSALRAAEMVEGVAAVVPTAEDLGPWADTVDKLVVSDGSFMRNVIAGVDSFRSERPVLLVTGDLPTLTGEDIDSFVRDSQATGADFTYPLVPKADMLEQYPGSERTFIKLRTGEITGGNMMLANPALVLRNQVIGQKLFDTRKSPVAMARAIGFRFVAKLAIGRLEVVEVERKMEELLGGKSAAVVTRRASIGADVDKPVDVVVAERVLHGRARA